MVYKLNVLRHFSYRVNHSKHKRIKKLCNYKNKCSNYLVLEPTMHEEHFEYNKVGRQIQYYFQKKDLKTIKKIFKSNLIIN